MKQYKFIQKLLLAVLALGCASCSQDEETQVNQQNLVVLNVTDAGLVSSESQTRTDDNGFVTTFKKDDELGLFAVKGGVIMDEINNMRLTYNGSSWSGKPILYDERLEGVVFYAYYPYQADMTGKTDLQGEDDFFAPLVDSWNLTNAQSDQKEYAKQDLMTSGKTELIGENGNYSLSFQLSHRMSLVVVKLPSTHYLFTDAEGTVLPEETPYIAKPNPASISFEIGEEKILPYYDAAKDEYRLLRKPSSAETITGYYNGKKCSLVTEGKMEQGKYKRFVVDGGHQEKKHHLQVGDFYYADGNIVSVTDENPPVKGCIGVVYYVGNPQPSNRYNEGNYVITPKMDVLKREHPNCSHGLVLALGPDIKGAWGDENTFLHSWFLTDFENNAAFTSLSGYYWGDTSTSVKNLDSRFGLGYNNIRVIEEYVKLNADAEEGKLILQHISSYQEKYPTPIVSTKWYVPAIGDFNNLIGNSKASLYSLLNQQIDKVGGLKLQANKEYWSSTERRKDLTFYAIFTGDGVASTNKTRKKNTASTYSLYRFGLAF
ncbi:fimbrillin family protein [Bacteroides zhangwenhongii]|uniref:fimbrillin family protein n=1 Tax=Bacteroides zhangwenhongii TaxID=2650157 RepID=UPI003AAF19D5